MLLRLACMLSGLGVALAGALLFSTGHAAHAACGGTLFPLGAAGCKGGTRSSGYRAARGEREKRPARVLVTVPAPACFVRPWDCILKG